MKPLLIVLITLLAGSDAFALTYSDDAAGSGGARSGPKPPVSHVINFPETISPDKEYTAEVVFSFGEGWHGYADDKANVAMGFIPTKVGFMFPEGVEAGDVVCSGGGVIYEGEVRFSLKFTYPRKAARKKKELPVTVKLQWQVCDENMCLPPENTTVEKSIRVK